MALRRTTVWLDEKQYEFCIKEAKRLMAKPSYVIRLALNRGIEAMKKEGAK